MGEAQSRLKNSKHKSKVKQFIDLFGKKQSLFNDFKSQHQNIQWIKKNVSPNVQIRISGKNLTPNRGNCISQFLDYYKTFLKSNFLEFKELLDVEYLGSSFQLVKFKCLLNKKYKITGGLWIVVKTGQLYQVDLKQQLQGGPTYFDIIWQQNALKYKDSVKYYPPSTSSNQTQNQNSNQSNNSYQKPTDWNAHYNAQTQRSNQQFREKMNKQAREWNDYARQKANRGW